jgi:capsular polysaccharide biosynthesis protein/Mrp family chromosome partitioning ATPase
LELSGYLAVARRWWWTLIVSAWIAGLTGYLVASAIPPTYESQVKVLVGPLNAPTDVLRSSGLLVQTYAQYVTTREVLASTIQELGLSLTPDDFAAATRATANDVTRILTIRVEASDPQQATDLANTLATELEQLTSGGLSRPEGLIQIIEFARPETTPVAPQVSLLVILAALAGVVMAIILVLLLEYFGNTIRTGQELATLARAALLGSVPAPSGDPPVSQDLVVQSAPGSRSAAPYRLISAKISLGPERENLRAILVTDVDWEGQAAVVGGNLAAALSRSGRHVVLIDGSGSSGTLTRLFGMQDRAGLSELLAESLAPVRPSGTGDVVSVLPAGRARLEGADPERLREVFMQLAGDGGLVVIVGAPIQASPVTLALARAADSVILVARRDRSRREDVEFAGESMRLIGAPVAGVILTERGGLRRLRRSTAPSEPGGAGRAVDVLYPTVTRPATVTRPTAVPAGRKTTAVRSSGAAGDRSQRRGRPRPSTGATQSIQPLEPDDGDSLPAT